MFPKRFALLVWTRVGEPKKENPERAMVRDPPMELRDFAESLRAARLLGSIPIAKRTLESCCGPSFTPAHSAKVPNDQLIELLVVSAIIAPVWRCGTYRPRKSEYYSARVLP